MGPYATLVERGVACDDQSHLIATMPYHAPGDGTGLSGESQASPVWGRIERIIAIPGETLQTHQPPLLPLRPSVAGDTRDEGRGQRGQRCPLHRPQNPAGRTGDNGSVGH